MSLRNRSSLALAVTAALFAVAGPVVAGSAAPAPVVAGPAEERPEVRTAMRASFAGLMGLLPYAASARSFSDPKNAEAIRQNLAALASLQHALPKSVASGEPGLQAIAGLFGDYLGGIQRDLEAGRREAARRRLQTVTQLCFGCHSRVRTTRSFEDVDHQVEAAALPPAERADFLAATRQFDRALAAYEALLAPTPRGERGALEFRSALRHALGILVRVKGDAKATVALLDRLLQRQDLPDHLLETVSAWRRDAVAWRAERDDAGKVSAEALVRRAAALVGASSGAGSVAPDARDELRYLRATNALHEALERDPKLPSRGEALYLLGVCSAELHDPLLWELDGLYFEACVRQAPHSEVARRCFRRLSDSIEYGYSGSAGTSIPDDELARLAELRALAR